MTTLPPSTDVDLELTARELEYLQKPRAIRERARLMLELARQDRLLHFRVREERLPELARSVLEFSLANHGDLARIPYHSRYRHFDAGGVQRLSRLEAELTGLPEAERLRCEADLVIVSVLLDAGAGPAFSYRDLHTGQELKRSEALAVASFDWFMSGALSNHGGYPPRVEAARLMALQPGELEQAFQVREDNPLLGVEGRTRILQRLGAVLAEGEAGPHARPGDLMVQLIRREDGATLRADSVFQEILGRLARIWPGRGGPLGANGRRAPLGDVFFHPLVGPVPFHKLSQWLTYSLCESLMRQNIRVTCLDALTGLPEYRNGGLLIDTGVLELKSLAAIQRVHPVDDPLVVEWRALTVALLDELAALVRARAGETAETLPLARLLEGGTWSLGRRYAATLRRDATPPLIVQSDGTVF